MTPLLCAIRGIKLQHPMPLQAAGRSHSAEHGSVDQDLINLVSHNHPCFKSDSEKIYFALEEAT